MSEHMEFLKKKDVLTFEEMFQICKGFIDLGVNKIRITGGEPLVRKNIMDFFSMLKPFVGVQLKEITLTTNGTQLGKYSKALYESGVRRVNVSLDSLNRDKFKDITRIGNLATVLNGIQSAKNSGLKVKINFVALKNINEGEINDFIEWCIEEEFDLTFIETMPMGDIGNENRLSNYLSLSELKKKLQKTYKLEDSDYSSGGPARYSLVKGSRTKLGFITPLSHNFCSTCNRVRIDATGIMHQCLGQTNSLDFRSILRSTNLSNQDILSMIRKAISDKPEKHSFEFDYSKQEIKGKVSRHMSLTGG
jgi:cyclic pyranopterin phosphate synthase